MSRHPAQENKVKAPLGASLIVASSFFYASYGIWTKLMGNFFGGYTASALRSVLVVIMLAPFAIAFKKLGPLNFKKTWPYIVGMIIASFFIWGPLYYAILHAGIGISLAINYACIVIGMFFFGWLLVGERFTKDKLTSAVLGLAGIALVFSPNTAGFGMLALTAAALSGFATAGNMILSKQIPFNATQTTLILWVTSIIANFIMVFLFRESIPTIGLHAQWLYLILFAVASIIASWSFVRGLKMVDAGIAGILGLLEIVFGVIFGIIFFAEKPDALAVLGVTIIIVAAAIPYLHELSGKRAKTTS
jgi:drug/metabolite transporter (DMT)-like permease